MDNCLIPKLFILFSFIMDVVYLSHIIDLSECPWKKDIGIIDDQIQP